MCRLFIPVVVAVSLSLDPFMGALASADDQAPGGTFQLNSQFVSGLRNPTAMAFAPDGRLFVTEQAGAIRVITSAGQLLPTPFLTVSARSDEERGLLGLAFDPDFGSNSYIYIFYTPSSELLTRISRVTANGNVAVPNSEVTLLEYRNFSSNHRGGDLHFGPDGKLYIAIGDAGDSGAAQQVTSFDGKLLRLNKDGTIPADNPSSFTNTSGATLTPAGQYRAIWAIGLRNPYRFAFDETNGAMRINDVGAGAWEETNIGRAGANYGWPTCEGTCSNGNADSPIYVHQRGPDGCAITGGAFYTGNQFPAEYRSNFFLIDYCSTWLRTLRADNARTTFPLAVPQFSVDLKVAPDGSLYVLGHGSGTISRITYSGAGSNRAPVARATANPTSGSAPLTVTFNGAGSTDADGDPLSFAWQFGDSTTGGGVSTSHTYSSGGTYVARLTVDDGRGGTSSQPLTITVGTPPGATITQPQQGTLYTAGQSISFSGTATDPEDGGLPPSAFSWTVLFHHDAHTHPVLGPLTGANSGSFQVPTTGHTEDNVFYRIYLTVTDSSGVQATVTRDVAPRKATITLDASVAGAQVLLDGQPRQTPLTFVGVVGVQRTIEVASPQTINGQQYQFVTWSNGEPRSQVISTPAADTTYRVTLSVLGTPTPPPPTPPPPTPPPPTPPPPTPPPPGAPPTLRWAMDNSLTESVESISTSGRGSIAYSSDAAPTLSSQASLLLNGSSDTYAVATGDRILNGWTAATTSVWVKIDSATAASWGNDTFHGLLFKYQILQTRILKDASGQLRLTATHSDGTPFGNPVVSTAVVPTNVWVNLVTVHEGSTVTLYVNGQAAGSGNTGRPLGAVSTERLDIVGFGGQFAGRLDELRIYNRALSAGELSGGTLPAPRPPSNIRIR